MERAKLKKGDIVQVIAPNSSKDGLIGKNGAMIKTLEEERFFPVKFEHLEILEIN